MYKRTKVVFIIGILFLIAIWGCGCKSTKEGQNDLFYTNLENRNKVISEQLSYNGSETLTYADKFALDYYENGYTLLTIADGARYLMVPKGQEPPTDLEEDIRVLKQPITNIYLVASAAMDMFLELDALSSVRFSGQKADAWCMEEVRKEMEKGNILYAGKYNMPDYELVLSEGCSLAIENNMISHSPEVIEKLESFQIPVFIDYASYENHPLGRVEWIKVYGALLGKREEAQAAFDKQMVKLEEVRKEEKSDKTVAFFFITANGMINVRNTSDYVPKMIELAGGKYVFDDLGEEESKRSSTTIQMEDFYHTAKDADFLIYNSTIDGELISIEELIAKDAMLEDFKAVQEGNVWCTTRDLYQQSMSVGGMIEDFYKMLSGEKQEEMTYIYQLK